MSKERRAKSKPRSKSPAELILFNSDGGDGNTFRDYKFRNNNNNILKGNKKLSVPH